MIKEFMLHSAASNALGLYAASGTINWQSTGTAQSDGQHSPGAMDDGHSLLKWPGWLRLAVAVGLAGITWAPFSRLFLLDL